MPSVGPDRTLQSPNSIVLPHPAAVAAYYTAIGVAGAAVSTSIPAVAGRLAYITGLTVTSNPPSVGTVPLSTTVALTDGFWTLEWQFTETVSAGGWMEKEFFYPLFASDLNTSISLSVPSVANGGIVSVEIHGYYL